MKMNFDLQLPQHQIFLGNDSCWGSGKEQLSTTGNVKRRRSTRHAPRMIQKLESQKFLETVGGCGAFGAGRRRFHDLGFFFDVPGVRLQANQHSLLNSF